MINANELMVGNYFLCNLFSVDEIYQVEEILKDGVRYGAEDGYIIPYADMEPIQITSEKLLKLGLKRNKWDDIMYNAGDFDLIFDDDEAMLSINGGEYVEGTCIRYIHQLQNISRSLYGKELTYAP